MKGSNLWEKRESLADSGVRIPDVDREKLLADTEKAPRWIHFGGGNLYRAFHAEIAQKLIEAGELAGGVVVCETFDDQVIDEIYQPYGNCSIEVIMHEDGTFEKKLLCSTAESFYCNPNRQESFNAVRAIFQNPSLQFATVTITEKGYGITDISGNLSPLVQKDIEAGPDKAAHTMSIITSLLLARYKENQAPIAMVSTDNFSRNGQKFQEAVTAIAKAWAEKGFAEDGFISYLYDPEKVSFPWSMIDRITPNPSEAVKEELAHSGIEGMDILHTEKHTNIAAFANTEETHYLVIEDSFPNGRPDLAKGGVIMTDRETVDKADTMKVTACLNPLHTTLAVYGCMLGFDSIAGEMEDPELLALIKGVGYKEGLPVVADPKIIDPKLFIDQLLTKRLPNPMIPDTPQRIAADTSQKVGIRYGETIRKYMEAQDKDSSTLKYIPLAIAGWLRYLIGTDDEGNPFDLSPDPLLEELQGNLNGLGVGKTEGLKEAVAPILSNTKIFGLDLYEAGLGEKIESYFAELLAGPGAIRAALKKYVN